MVIYKFSHDRYFFIFNSPSLYPFPGGVLVFCKKELFKRGGQGLQKFKMHRLPLRRPATAFSFSYPQILAGYLQYWQKSSTMKNFILIILFLFGSISVFAQLKPRAACPTFKVDVLRGTISNTNPEFTIAQIKDKLPCATGEEEESKTARCGGGIFYKDKDVYFYTQRDYIEIGSNYKGEFSFPVMNTKRGSLFAKLGNPKLKDTEWDAYQTQYGTLVLFYNKQNAVNKIIITSKSTEDLDLCE